MTTSTAPQDKIDSTTGNLAESTPLHVMNGFLRGELAAAATYEQAMQHLEDADARIVLEQCRQSHTERAVLLGQEIWRRGEFPPETAGVWGAFAKAVELGAALLGDDALLKALLVGELDGLDSYEAGLVVMDPAARMRVSELLLAPQRMTAEKIGALIEERAAPEEGAAGS